jgi:hypothetical protein
MFPAREEPQIGLAVRPENDTSLSQQPIVSSSRQTSVSARQTATCDRQAASLEQLTAPPEQLGGSAVSPTQRTSIKQVGLPAERLHMSPKGHVAWIKLLQILFERMAGRMDESLELQAMWTELQETLPQRLAVSLEPLATSLYKLTSSNEQPFATSSEVTKSFSMAETVKISSSDEQNPSPTETLKLPFEEPVITVHEVKTLLILSEISDVITTIFKSRSEFSPHLRTISNPIPTPSLPTPTVQTITTAYSSISAPAKCILTENIASSMSVLCTVPSLGRKATITSRKRRASLPSDFGAISTPDMRALSASQRRVLQRSVPDLEI